MPEFVVRAIVREMESGWRLLTDQGYAVNLALPVRDPSPDWEEIHRQLLGVDLDGVDAAKRAAKLLPQLGYAPDLRGQSVSGTERLTFWSPSHITPTILLRLKIVQSTLRFLENLRFDPVDEIRKEYLYKELLAETHGEALDRTAGSLADISKKEIIAFLRQNSAGVPSEDPQSPNPRYGQELIDQLNAFASEKGLDQSAVLDVLLKATQRDRPRVPNSKMDDPFIAMGFEGLQLPAVSVEQPPKVSKAGRRPKTAAAGKLRAVVSDDAIANGVAQYLTNFGRGAIRSDFVFAADGTPTVYLYADEPLSELILRAHARRTLPRMIRCRNPRCLTGVFQPSRPDQVHCESGTCREYVKKTRQRSIAKARVEWESMAGDWRKSADRTAWIAERASTLASSLAGGTFNINEEDVVRNTKRRRRQ